MRALFMMCLVLSLQPYSGYADTGEACAQAYESKAAFQEMLSSNMKAGSALVALGGFASAVVRDASFAVTYFGLPTGIGLVGGVFLTYEANFKRELAQAIREVETEQIGPAVQKLTAESNDGLFGVTESMIGVPYQIAGNLGHGAVVKWEPVTDQEVASALKSLLSTDQLCLNGKARLGRESWYRHLGRELTALRSAQP